MIPCTLTIPYSLRFIDKSNMHAAIIGKRVPELALCTAIIRINVPSRTEILIPVEYCTSWEVSHLVLKYLDI